VHGGRVEALPKRGKNSRKNSKKTFKSSPKTVKKTVKKRGKNSQKQSKRDIKGAWVHGSRVEALPKRDTAVQMARIQCPCAVHASGGARQLDQNTTKQRMNT
jgi:hypothetical protein